ncbi:hypothetical protein C8F04DRAFT_1269714 [Mycena alexandri]|uniref:Uncharacterized protein n=1 Tax=Mycena alexandri TaxID=1745969 RepID=A0AAD6SF80_9AGAR|nr:hypothetical protein C8F04DRAFT_1269714 [Mycena alexandri]
MQLTATFATFAALVATAAAASVPEPLAAQQSCNAGNYHDHIVQTLTAAGQSTDEAHVDNSLFDCLSGGEIRFISFCANGCGGTTTTNADFCL